MTCLLAYGVQASTQISTAAMVPVVTAVQKLAGFSVATFDAAAQSTVRPLKPPAQLQY